jgi:two-component system, cell cycle sensor histidine kinase PleC
MRRVVMAAVVLLGLALAMVSGLEELEGHHMETLIGYSEDNASWAVHQLEAEQQRLEIALLHARNAVPANLEAAALRYETFASRRNILATGVFHRKLRDLPAYPVLMHDFERFLAANDPSAADGLQATEVEPMLAAAAAMRKPVHALVLAENAMLNQLQADSRAHLAGAERTSNAALGVVGVVLLGFAGYAMVVLHRAQKSELALARQEHMLRDALREAQSASAAKSSFLANMSHELRTPLNAVIGFSEFLEISAAHRLDERQRGYLSDIRASGRHLLGILSTILEVSKLEAGKVELQIERVPAAALIEECQRMLACKAAQKEIAIDSAGLEDLPPIQGDATRLRQVFLNLLTNAVKYSGPGTLVRVTGSAGDGHVTVRIEDDGIGMSREDIEIALRPFERIRGAETQEGVGLGLTIVTMLVEIHGGAFELESEVGRGTAAIVRLPAAAPRAEARMNGGAAIRPPEARPVAAAAT